MTQTINGKQYEDIQAKCQDCGQGYLFTAGEQAFFATKGFTPPKRCKPCRDANRANKEQQRQEREADRSMPDMPRTGRRDRR